MLIPQDKPVPLCASRSGADTLVEHFREVFLRQPDEQTYRFLVDGEGEPIGLSNAEIDLRARAVAAALREGVEVGARALIICPPGLDYVTAFLGCLYAGVVAVPVYPLDPVLLKRTLPRLLGVIEDARPAVVLAMAELTALSEQICEQAPGLRGLRWIAVDEIQLQGAQDWSHPDIGGQDVAFLQYTSGSTGRPKGVVVSHSNLLHNLDVIHQKFVGEEPNSHQITWLPPYHDMGLIGGLLQPAYGGFPVTIMSPIAFLKKPLRWLRAISDLRGTLGGAPNFAYDLCVDRTTPQQREELDLSSWSLAFSGAEPVRARTLERFAEAFAPSKFRRTSFYPCYGMAEVTLFISGGNRTAEPVVMRVCTDEIARGKVLEVSDGKESREFVGCGSVVRGHEIIVVDPESRLRLPEGSVGEIWTRGPSIAQGYWENPEVSEETFAARLSDTGDGPFLRTGDLGFLRNAELFLTGRSKDVIIIAGKNHYPQDIELTVERCHPRFVRGCSVAFSVDSEGEERLVVVQEFRGSPTREDLDEALTSVRTAVAQDHGLVAHEVLLVRRGTVPKTTSGKLQRSACRGQYLEGRISVLTAEETAVPTSDRTAPAVQTTAVRSPDNATTDSVGRAGPGAPSGSTAQTLKRAFET